MTTGVKFSQSVLLVPLRVRWYWRVEVVMWTHLVTLPPTPTSYWQSAGTYLTLVAWFLWLWLFVLTLLLQNLEESVPHVKTVKLLQVTSSW